jgi:ankyrin repeat protein
MNIMAVLDERDLLKILMLDAGNDLALSAIVEKYGVNAVSIEGRSILTYAILHESEFLSAYLISQAKCDVNYREPESGFTALHFAVQDNFHLATRLLLGRSDLKIDNQDNWGNTPLSCALTNGNPETIILEFLDKGADIDLENYSGVSPRDLLGNSYKNVVQRLKMAAPKNPAGRTKSSNP